MREKASFAPLSPAPTGEGQHIPLSPGERNTGTQGIPCRHLQSLRGRSKKHNICWPATTEEDSSQLLLKEEGFGSWLSEKPLLTQAQS